MDKPRFLFLVGPTGVGKSALALELATPKAIPIINFDSVQTYKLVDIGTAKPTRSERDLAPHHLFDFISPPETITAARYLEEVDNLFTTSPFQKALFVGGSGFYYQALQKGLYPQVEVSQEVSTQVQDWMQFKTGDEIWQWIHTKDPESAERIHPNDRYRLKRTLEILLTQGVTRGELQKRLEQEELSPLPPHDCLTIGLFEDRERLRQNLEARTEKMLQRGWIDEVARLMSQGLEGWAPMQSVGYKEVVAFLKSGKPSLSDLKDEVVMRSMQLAKKQMTWFRRENSIAWFSLEEFEVAKERAHRWLLGLQD